MNDPREGLDEQGFITTGVRRDRVPALFEPVLEAAVAGVASIAPQNSGDHAVELRLYGSVATGTAKPGESDVDLFTIGMAGEATASLSAELSASFASLCRGVEIGAAQREDYEGDSDASYGNRLFRRHYSVSLLGIDSSRREPAFRGDARAARGLNGDIGIALSRWRSDAASDPASGLARHLARKTLLAIAGLVSVHDATWTTDRASSALRWGQLHPEWASSCGELVSWSGGSPVSPTSRDRALSAGGVVDAVVRDFHVNIGLWKEDELA